MLCKQTSIETDPIDFTTNGFDALIELRIEAKDAGNLTCNDAAIALKDLPYGV